MENVLIRRLSKSLSKKGDPYFFGPCSVSGQSSIKRFYTFNDRISEIVTHEDQWIRCSIQRRPFEPEKIIIYEIVLPEDKGKKRENRNETEN